MHGLVEYDGDSQSDSDTQPSSSRITSNSRNNTNDKSLKAGSTVSSEARKLQKAQIIIRKPPKTHSAARAHVSDDLDDTEKSLAHAHLTQVSNQGPSCSQTQSQSQRQGSQPIDMDSAPATEAPLEAFQNELSQIRALLRPPPIPGVEDWGIPPESTKPPDPVIVAKLAQFHTLKRDPANPKHFNDSLMSNRSFRNPHLYAKLVEFVDVNERSTNFPKEIWDVGELKEEWHANRIAELQKGLAGRQTAAQAAQAAGKRTQINFTSSTASTSSRSGKERDGGHAMLGSAVGRKSRFQPYGLEGAPVSGSGGNRREGSRWGPG